MQYQHGLDINVNTYPCGRNMHLLIVSRASRAFIKPQFPSIFYFKKGALFESNDSSNVATP